ncbi:MAG: hypothetical protein V3R73_04965 [Sphingomonadales bacterium]
MRSFFMIFTVSLVFLLAPGRAMAGEPNQYRLTFKSIEARQIKVEAEVQLSGNSLVVDAGEIWYLPETTSWWDRISVERLEDMAGNPLKLGERQGPRRRIEGPEVGRVRIAYTVDISFIDKHLPYGNSAAGAAFPEGYFTVARPLFVAGETFSGASITVEKPGALQFDAPWKLKEGVYYAATFKALTRAAVSFGNYKVLGSPEGNLDYRLIAFGLEPEVRALLNRTMTTVTGYYLEKYPLPNPSRYIQYVYPAHHLGGEAYAASSVSAVVPAHIGEGRWKLTMAHELFHVWNPFLIPGAQREEMEWFKEGFTNYISETTLLKAGEISRATWEGAARNHHQRYLEALKAAPETITIVSSGADKGKYGRIVYDGGAVIAAWLDRELTRVSSGDIDLTGLLGLLINRAHTEKKTLDVPSFLAAVSAIDPAVARNLKTYLTTRTPVPQVIGLEPGKD